MSWAWTSSVSCLFTDVLWEVRQSLMAHSKVPVSLQIFNPMATCLHGSCSSRPSFAMILKGGLRKKKSFEQTQVTNCILFPICQMASVPCMCGTGSRVLGREGGPGRKQTLEGDRQSLPENSASKGDQPRHKQRPRGRVCSFSRFLTELWVSEMWSNPWLLMETFRMTGGISHWKQTFKVEDCSSFLKFMCVLARDHGGWGFYYFMHLLCLWREEKHCKHRHSREVWGAACIHWERDSVVVLRWDALRTGRF